MLFLILATALLQGSSTPAPDSTGVRNPAFSRDGRLAVSVAGDIWVVAKSGAWQRVTSGPAWDREPAWTPDGIGDRLLVGSIGQVRSLARRHACRPGRRAGARATHVVFARRRGANRAARRTHRVRPRPTGRGASLGSLDHRLGVPPHEGFAPSRNGPRRRPTARASRTSRSPTRRENFTYSRWTPGRTAPC